MAQLVAIDACFLGCSYQISYSDFLGKSITGVFCFPINICHSLGFIVTRYLAATATQRSRCDSSSGTYRRPRMVGKGNSRCYWSSRSLQLSLCSFNATHLVLLRFRIHFQFFITRLKRTSISFRHNILNSHPIQGNDYSSSLVSQPQTFRESLAFPYSFASSSLPYMRPLIRGQRSTVEFLVSTSCRPFHPFSTIFFDTPAGRLSKLTQALNLTDRRRYREMSLALQVHTIETVVFFFSFFAF